MKHVHILAKFLELFPNFQETIRCWKPYAKDAIQVTLNNHLVLVFKYASANDFFLGTESNVNKRG